MSSGASFSMQSTSDAYQLSIFLSIICLTSQRIIICVAVQFDGLSWLKSKISNVFNISINRLEIITYKIKKMLKIQQLVSKFTHKLLNLQQSQSTQPSSPPTSTPVLTSQANKITQDLCGRDGDADGDGNGAVVRIGQKECDGEKIGDNVIDDKISKLRREILGSVAERPEKRMETQKFETNQLPIEPNKNDQKIPNLIEQNSSATTTINTSNITKSLPIQTQSQCAPIQLIDNTKAKQKKYAILGKKMEKQKQAEGSINQTRLTQFFHKNGFPKQVKLEKQTLLSSISKTESKQHEKSPGKIVQNAVTSNKVNQNEQLSLVSSSLPALSTPDISKPIENMPLPLPLPYQFMINNLLTLAFSNSVAPDIITLYICELEEKHGISYTSIIVTFGVEYLVAKFYDVHDMQYEMNAKYILYYLDKLLPDLIALLKIDNWYTLCEICRGVTCRFGPDTRKLYNKDWVYFAIRRGLNVIKQAGIDVEQLLAPYNELQQLPQKKDITIKLDPSKIEKLRTSLKYTNLRQYLAEPNNKIKKNIVFDETNEQVRADSIDREGLNKDRLRKYIAIKRSLNPSKYLEEEEVQDKVEEAEKNTYQEINFQILKQKYKIPPGTIFHDSYQQLFANEVNCATFTEESIDSKSQSNQSIEIEPPVPRKRKSCYLPVAKKCATNVNPKIKYAPIYNYDQQVSQPPQQNSFSEQIAVDKKNKSEQKDIPSRTPKTEILSTLWSQKLKKKAMQKKEVNIPEIITRMDHLIFKYHQKNPGFTMEEIIQYISKILTEQIKVPQSMHEMLTNMWFDKYKN